MTAPYIASNQEKIRQIVDPLIDGARPFALLDFPDHDNIGDSAIYRGTMAYLRARGMCPSYVATTNNCDWRELEAAVGDGPILLHGGGNFGDIWPWFQPFREEVLARYPGRSVIQMPQTIHYRSQERIDQTARAIERHGAFTLLVRDRRSYDLAKASFACEVHLCPDMAFHIGEVPRGRPTKDLLLHLRTDKEAAETRQLDGTTPHGAEIRDWPGETPDDGKMFDARAKPRMLLAYLAKGRAAARVHRYEGRARARTRRGLALLESYRQVVTDRLHGHIMCSLLQIPHRIIDNSYGKLGQYIGTWGSDPVCRGIFPNVEAALESLEEESKGLKPGTLAPSAKRSITG